MWIKRQLTRLCIAQQDEKHEERGTWASPAEFVLSCLGYAVGLGNVWRFPYLCYINGGGAFLIPYFIMLTFVGIPVFMIELSMGQYASSGPMTVWECAPLFQGIGAGMIFISFIGNIYYNMIITWSLYYMFASMQATLPWDGCHRKWNTMYCYDVKQARECEFTNNGTWINKDPFVSNSTGAVCYNATQNEFLNEYFGERCNRTETEMGLISESCWNITRMEYLEEIKTERVSSPEEYFNFEVLDRSDTMEDAGYMKWDLSLVLFLAWIVCYLCVLRGIKSSGKVVYFTATFPYVVLVILFFRGVTLDGAKEGILFYINPRFELLANPKVWADAAGQIFFSLSVGFGGLMAFSSYNKFNNNIYRDTLFVSICNCCTSFFAGFAIFSILGYMAKNLNKEVKDVVNSGSGLAFVAYPEVFTLLPAPQLWSFIFFFMLLTLGLDSQFAGIENVMTAVMDMYPKLRKYKSPISGLLCIICFILGFSMCTRSGVYWLELMSYYSSGWALVVMGLLEAIVFPWIYGADNMIDNIEDMVGFRLYKHWWVCWKFITPLLLTAVLIVNFYDFSPLEYGTYVLPSWAQGIGWCMALFAVFVVPAGAAFKVWQTYRGKPGFEGLTVWQRIKKLTKPSENWGPLHRKAPKVDPAIWTVNQWEEPKETFDNPAFTSSSVDTSLKDVSVRDISMDFNNKKPPGHNTSWA